MQILQNNVAGVLSGAITAADKSIPLLSVTGWPVLSSGDYHLGTLVGLGPNGTETAWEVVKVTGRVGNALSVDRAQEGTTAQAWPAGTVIQMRLTAGSVATPSLVDAVRIALEQLIASSVQTSEQGTALQLADKVDVVAGKGLSANDFTAALLTKLNGIAAGAQVNVATNIGQGTRTTTGIPLTSSTGTGTTLPVATTALAGLMASADKTKLDGVAAGAQVNVATNLTVTAAAAKVTVASSTGSSADIALATAALAGLMAPADFSKLAGIAAGATVDWVATPIPANANANTYTAQGAYVCEANATSATVLNLPDAIKGSAFSLNVFQAAGCIQWISKYANSNTGTLDTFIRGNYNSFWTPWYRVFHEGTPQTTTTTDADGTNNTNIASTAFVQSAVGGYLSKAVTGGTVTLTAAESSNPVIALTGTLASNLNLVLPATVKRLWAIFNNTAGAFTVTVKLATGTGVTVAQGKRNLVYTDGTNVYDGFNDFESITITGSSVAPTQAATDNSTKLATTAFVQSVNFADTGGSATAVKLKTARTIALSGGATGTATDFDGSANISIPVTALNMGNATAGTLAVARGGTGTTTSTGTGANVQAVSPALTGAPTVPTAAASVNTTQIASTAFVQTAATSAKDRENHTGTQAIDTVSGLPEALDAGLRVRIFTATSIVDFLRKIWAQGQGYYRCDSVITGLQQYAAGFLSMTADTYTFISCDYLNGRPVIFTGTKVMLDAGQYNRFVPTERASHTGTQDISTITGVVGAGGVIRRGTTANGDWIQFADGTQICVASRREPDGPWWFPAAFIGARPILSTGVVASNTEIIIRFTAINTDRAVFEIRYWNAGKDWAAGAGEYIDMIAIGKWK